MKPLRPPAADRSLPHTLPARRCWAEVDLAALRHNVGALRAALPPGTGVMAIVKANAYGHGLGPVATALHSAVEAFGVANLAEAVELRRHVAGARVLLLGPALPEERPIVVASGLEAVVSSLEEGHAYAALGSAERPARLHLAVDTGMGRIGIAEPKALALAKALAALPGVRLVGVGTHLPSADEDDAFTREQLTRWAALAGALREAGLVEPELHALNSAGTLAYGATCPGGPGWLARTGLALYGSAPLPEAQPRLRPVLTWKTRITLLRDLPPGTSLSYGRTYTTPAPMRVATLAAGYADGYRRHLSGAGAEVLIRGHRCPVRGRVTMDQILADVSAVPGVAEGDEVVLLGRQGGEEILAAELAQKAGTIPWEIFTGLAPRVARHYLERK